MAEFYKMNPSDWDYGTHALSLEEEAAYLRIVNAIQKHDAPVPNNDRVLAGMFRCSTRKARALLAALIEAGKVRIEDGAIVQDRAISEVFHRRFTRNSRAEAGAKGGRTRAENAAKSQKSNDSNQALASTREEKRREEYSVSKDTGAAAPKVDPEKVMFDAGVALLTASGKSERDARSMVGMWRKQHGAEAVISAVGRAQREGPVDAVAFMQGIFRQKRKAGPEAGSERVRDGQREVYEPAVGAWVPQWG